MRIAIYDPEPSACGLMTWARHMQAGVRQLGHDCDVVSLTKSGRPRKSWGRPEPGTSWYDRPLDAVGSYKDCKAFLGQYDGVVLTELEVGLQDREAVRNGWVLPYYARALQVAEVPFTAVLQSYDYGPDFAEFAAATVSLPGFTGAGIAHAVPSRVIKGNAVLKNVEWQQVAHPYVPSVLGHTPQRGVAGCTGRFAHINAFHLAGFAAAYGWLPLKTTVQFRGAAAVSNRASFALDVFEFFRDNFGYVNSWREDGDVFRPKNWVLWNDSSILRYDGAYAGAEEAVRACMTMQVHVSLMAEDKSTGAENYCQLEAADAGCLLVATECHADSSLQMMTLPGLSSTPSMGKVIKEEDIRGWISRAAGLIGAALDKGDTARQSVIDENRDALRTAHDPQIAAKALVEALGG